MEIPSQLFSWLKESGILKSDHDPNNQSIQLTESESEKLELGLILPLISQFTQIGIPKESELKTTNSKVSRLNNWNLLMKPLESLKVKINSDMKALLVAGDRQQVIEILLSLQKSVFLLAKKKQTKMSYEGGLLLDNINLSTQLIDSETVLEFLVLSFCKSFKVSPKVSAGLLSQNGSFLSQIIKKGLKHNFQPVLFWLDLVNGFLVHLASLIEREKKSIKYVLGLLKNGLSSSSLEVVNKSAEVLGNLKPFLSNFEEESLEWFIEDCLISCIKLIEKKDCSNVVELIVIYCKKDLHFTFSKLKSHFKNNLVFLVTIQNLLRHFSTIDMLAEVFNCGLVREWIQLCLNLNQNEGKNPDVQACSLGLLCDIWIYFWKHLESQEELSSSILTFIKKAVREGSRSFKILAFGKFFEIFNIFTVEKVALAPILYKTLVFCAVENYQDDKIREFMLVNFIRILNENLNVPLGILIEPLAKQALLLSNNFDIFDFDFYISIGRHPLLELKDAIIIIDLCSKCITSDSIYSKTAEIPFLIISARFVSQTVCQDYLQKFISFILKSRSLSIKPEDSDLNDRNLKIIEKITQLNQIELNHRIKDIIHYFFPDLRKTKDKHLETLFKSLFNPFHSNPLQFNEAPSKSDSYVVSVLNSMPKSRVLLELEKIKQKKMLKEFQEKLENEQRSVKASIQKKALKHQINKRRVELGIVSRAEYSKNVVMINDSFSNEFVYDFTKISEEPIETRRLIQITIKNSKNLIRAIFNKYLGAGYNKKISATPTFEKAKKIKDNLTENDLSLMLRDFSILNTKVSPAELKKLYMECCENKNGLEFKNFINFLYLLSRLISFKDPVFSEKLPEAVIFQDFFDFIKDRSARLIPKNLLEPDLGFRDRDLVKYLNEKLEADPLMALPEPYKKHEEISLKIIHEPLFGKSSERISILIIDDLLFGLFKFHFLMPIIQQKSKFRVKPTSAKDNSKISLNPFAKIGSNPGFSKLPPHLKLHVIQTNQNENWVLECAQVVDDLIFSIEKGSSFVISRFPRRAGTLTNRITQEKLLIEAERLNQSERAELKRKVRAKKISEEAEKFRIKKEYDEFVLKEEQKKAAIQARFVDKINQREWDKKRIEINEKILEHKLGKIDKQLENQSEGRLPKRKIEYKINQSFDIERNDSLEKRRFLNDRNKKTRSVPKVFGKFFKN